MSHKPKNSTRSVSAPGKLIIITVSIKQGLKMKLNKASILCLQIYEYVKHGFCALLNLTSP